MIVALSVLGEFPNLGDQNSVMIFWNAVLVVLGIVFSFRLSNSSKSITKSSIVRMMEALSRKVAFFVG